MKEFLYAVHTDVCTYLLDENGICTWVLSPNPQSAKLMVCMGAQFVACVDPRVEGAIVGELKEGARALLVAISKETGRAQLLRTGPIRRVQYRDGGEAIDLGQGLDVLEEVELELDEEPLPPPPVAAPTPSQVAPPPPAQVAPPPPAKPASSPEPMVAVHKPPRRAEASLVAQDPRSVIISEPPQPAPNLQPKLAHPHAEPAVAVKPAGSITRGSSKSRPSPSEVVGLPPPRRPSSERQSADDTLRINARKKKS